MAKAKAKKAQQAARKPEWQEAAERAEKRLSRHLGNMQYFISSLADLHIKEMHQLGSGVGMQTALAMAKIENIVQGTLVTISAEREILANKARGHGLLETPRAIETGRY